MGPVRRSSLRLGAATLTLAAGLVLTAPLAAANAGEAVEEVKKVETTEQAAQEAPCDAAVAIDGGDVANETTVDIAADGGTAISDASGGDENFGPEFVGNGGTSEASADGGAIGIGDVNSGDNAGNEIAVGDIGADCATPKEIVAAQET